LSTSPASKCCSDIHETCSIGMCGIVFENRSDYCRNYARLRKRHDIKAP
jgi:hypothetical protein